MPKAIPPVSPRARVFQNVLLYGGVALLALLGFRILARASDLPDWILTVTVLAVFLGLPISAVILWLLAHRRS